MNRRTFLLAFAAAGALLVVWFLMLWAPQSGKLGDAHDRTAAATATNDALQLRLARLQAAKVQEPELQTDFDQLRSAVPDDPELAQFILDANQAATDSGVDFLSISPGVPQQSDPTLPAVISLAITVKGGYYEALDYLEQVSAMKRVVVIDTLALTPGDTSTGLQDLTIAISARMFTTAVPPVAGAAATTTTTTAPPAGDANEQVTTSTQAPPDITVTANRP